ncbi:MAG: hypothetical protein ACRETP_14105 [Steroidobacteraceae bacterium]
MKFGQLPLLARVAVGVSLWTFWWTFEEFIVDRVGLWKYMPGYRVGEACVWDLSVGTLIVVGLVWASRGNRVVRSD